MCMKYVNSNIQCFDLASKGLFGTIGLSDIIESVKSSQKDDKFVVGNFNIVAFINIRGTKSETNKNNPLDMGRKLNFRIRLTKLSETPEKQLSYDLKDFDIDLSDKSIIKEACFKYVERIDVTPVKELQLNDKGAYVIKLLVKDSDEELYDVQMLHPLYVK